MTTIVVYYIYSFFYQDDNNPNKWVYLTVQANAETNVLIQHRGILHLQLTTYTYIHIDYLPRPHHTFWLRQKYDFSFKVDVSNGWAIWNVSRLQQKTGIKPFPARRCTGLFRSQARRTGRHAAQENSPSKELCPMLGKLSERTRRRKTKTHYDLLAP